MKNIEQKSKLYRGLKMDKINLKVHPLKAWRVGQNLTQTEVATILGYLTPGIVHNIETYKIDPKISEIKKLCDLSENVLTPWDFLETEK